MPARAGISVRASPIGRRQHLYCAETTSHGDSMSAPSRISAISCAATLSALLTVAAGAALPGAGIERSYAEAFDRMGEANAGAAATLAGRIDPAHLHLSAMKPADGVTPPVAVGDRITLSAREGGAVSYEVIEVRPISANLDAAGSGSAAGQPHSRLMLVTAVSAPMPKAKTVRFIVDADASTDSTLPGLVRDGKPHAL